MDHRERAQRTLYRLTHLLAMGTQGSSLLRTILREALGLTGARGGQVLLLSADRRGLLTHVGEGDGNADGEAIAADAPPWADAIREGKVVCLRATPTAVHPLSADRPITLGIPLLARGDVLGVLALRDLSAEWAKPERAPLVEILVDETNHMLWMRATHGGSQTWMQYPPLDLATSFLGEVVRSGSPLAVLDLQDKIHHCAAPFPGGGGGIAAGPRGPIGYRDRERLPLSEDA